MSVLTYIEKPDGTKFRTRFDGDVVPPGCTCVIEGPKETVRFPYVSGTDNYGKMQLVVDRLLAEVRIDSLP